MTNDKSIEHYENMMNEFDDYTCDADDYVELVASVKALRQCLREIRLLLPTEYGFTREKITDCLEGK